MSRSILLGLYDDDGLLHHVEFSSGIKAREKPALSISWRRSNLSELYGNAPGGPSRWSTKRSSEWQPLRPKYCGLRFLWSLHRRTLSARHVNPEWRPDKKPRQCTFEQLNQKINRRLTAIITSKADALAGAHFRKLQLRRYGTSGLIFSTISSCGECSPPWMPFANLVQ